MSNKTDRVGRINKILYESWDPIGVPGLPSDEYLDYAKVLAGMDLSDAKSNLGAMVRVAAYLMLVEVQTLQVRSQPNFDKKLQDVAYDVAAAIVHP